MLLRTTVLLSLVTTLASCGASTSEAGPKVAPQASTTTDATTNATATPTAPEAAGDASPALDADAAATTHAPEAATMNNVYALKAQSLDGKPVDLAEYKGKVTLIVNVASACGYTPQYAGLQQLHAELAGRGFAVLGFPSNEFGGQEPGNADEIAAFCSSKFGVAFPLFEKIETKSGANQSPVYGVLEKSTGKLPNWNFCKYLVGKDGAPIAFYPSKVAPDAAELREAIEKALL
jgi:glutathione peroxidase